eukprot:scaffold2447_cov110-Cylindrotheca_fusiformis.AAC.5
MMEDSMVEGIVRLHPGCLSFLLTLIGKRPSNKNEERAENFYPMPPWFWILVNNRTAKSSCFERILVSSNLQLKDSLH